MKNLVTIKEFCDQVKKVEGFDISLSLITFFKQPESIMIEPYPYTTPFDGSRTIDEFKEERINPCFQTIVIE